MYVLTEEQKEDSLVKSLVESGFSEETVAEWIAKGSIDLAKSTQYGPDDHGEGAGDDVDEKRDKKQEKDEKKEKKKIEEEDDDDEKDFEKGKGKKDCDMGGGDKKTDELAKSLGLDVFYKSLSDELLGAVNATNDEFAKSIPAIVEKTLEPALEAFADRIEKSISGMRMAIQAFGDAAPSFKTAGLSKAIIEKSIEHGGGVKDEEGHVALSASRDRAVVRELILKSIAEEPDKDIQKSLNDGAMAYVLDPVGGAIGENVAQYLYANKKVRLVK